MWVPVSVLVLVVYIRIYLTFLKCTDETCFCLHKTSARIGSIEMLFKYITLSFIPFKMLWCKLTISFHQNEQSTFLEHKYA